MFEASLVLFRVVTDAFPQILNKRSCCFSLTCCTASSHHLLFNSNHCIYFLKPHLWISYRQLWWATVDPDVPSADARNIWTIRSKHLHLNMETWGEEPECNTSMMSWSVVFIYLYVRKRTIMKWATNRRLHAGLMWASAAHGAGAHMCARRPSVCYFCSLKEQMDADCFISINKRWGTYAANRLPSLPSVCSVILATRNAQ